MGAHHPRHAAPESRQLRRIAFAMIAPFAVATFVAMIWLWPPGDVTPESASAEQFNGEVVAIDEQPCAEELADDVNGCGTASVRVTSGADDGREVTTALPNGPGAPEIAEGDDVVLI